MQLLCQGLHSLSRTHHGEVSCTSCPTTKIKLELKKNFQNVITNIPVMKIWNDKSQWLTITFQFNFEYEFFSSWNLPNVFGKYFYKFFCGSLTVNMINSLLNRMHSAQKMNNFWQSTTTSLTNHLHQSNIKSLIFQEKMVQKIKFVPAVRCQRD